MSPISSFLRRRQVGIAVLVVLVIAWAFARFDEAITIPARTVYPPEHPEMFQWEKVTPATMNASPL